MDRIKKQKTENRKQRRTRTVHCSLFTVRSPAFTVIELLVVCGIMVVVSAIIFANNNRFGGQVLLQNFAYDLALSVRQAQVYGISVRRFGASTFSAGYGMHFDLQDPYDYVLFADAASPVNGLYDGPSELVQSTSINRGYFVSKLCAPAGTDASCTSGTSVSKLDVLFIRPEPDAWISGDASSCVLNKSLCQPSARIVVESPRGDSTTMRAEG